MDDFFDDFDSDYDDEFKDEIMDDMDGLDDDSATHDQESDDPDSDDFTAKDAFILGGAMGWAYEEGLQDAIKRRRFRIAKKRHPK